MRAVVLAALVACTSTPRPADDSYIRIILDRDRTARDLRAFDYRACLHARKDVEVAYATDPHARDRVLATQPACTPP